MIIQIICTCVCQCFLPTLSSTILSIQGVQKFQQPIESFTKIKLNRTYVALLQKYMQYSYTLFQRYRQACHFILIYTFCQIYIRTTHSVLQLVIHSFRISNTNKFQYHCRDQYERKYKIKKEKQQENTEIRFLSSI